VSKKELLAALKILKAGYISSQNSLEMINNWGKTQLEALYATKIGRYKVQLLELQIEYKAEKKKIQLCHQAFNSNEEPDFAAIEAKVAGLTNEAYQEIRIEKDKISFAKAILSNLRSPEDSIELRKIYRNIAKNLHPDVNPNLTEEQTEIWHLFYSAYKNGDLDKMKALEIIYEKELQNSDLHAEVLSEETILLQTILLKEGIKEIENQIKDVEKDFPFNISELIRDEEWVEEQQNLLTKEIEELKIALKELQENYLLIKESYE
jgi:hypothetical protein